MMSATDGSAAARHGHETERLVRRELGAAYEERIERGPFGISLSGGGIRSATFTLGLLQGLHRSRLLDCFDYVSTVSGGGYTGSFWSAWRRSHGTLFPAQTPGSEHPAIRHLREFSNFLSPRLALLSYDTGRMIVAPLAAAVPSLLVALSLIVLVLSGWSLLGWLLLEGSDAVSFGALGALVAVTLLGFEVKWRRREGHAAERYRDATYAAAAIGAVVLTLLAWAAVRPRTARFDTSGFPLYTGDTGAVALFAPALACLVAILVLVIVRSVVLRWAESHGSAFDRVLARLLLIAAAWSVIAALWLVGMRLPRIAGAPLANASWFGALTSVLTGAFLWSRSRLERQPNKPFGDSVLARLKPKLPQLLAYAVVTLMVLLCVVTLAWWQAQGEQVLFGRWRYDPLHAVIGGAAVILALGLLLFHPNRLGLHAFYRGRIARAFTGAANPLSHRQSSADGEVPPQRVTEALEGDDFPVTELARDRPVHLVCCAANDLAPLEPLTTLHRGADSAVLSAHAFSVGACWSEWDGAAPTLAGAATASGAAFNSMMGAYSKRFGPASTFLMASLNLRLGMWLRHPRAARRGAREWLPPGVLFLKELFGISSAVDDDVHLSDGGHFENTGTYELLRRRCRYIIAADCGADPDFAFDDVGNLVRRAREDFDIEIRIDLSPLVPSADGTARQPMVAGDIHYPDGVTGVLLLFKPTLIGSEPADVTQYRSRNSVFPAESTGDQFYDEAQWEAYRRLGQFAAETAFGFVDQDPELRAPTPDHDDAAIAARAARIFARARFEWLPRPVRLEAQLAEFTRGAAALDKRVATTHPALYREVLKEADELRRQSGGAEAERTTERDYASALRPARDAASFLERTYYVWDLETTRAQPLSLGVMNYFARWTYAPLFRMWWPVMRSTLTPQFARFLEREFGLERIPPHREDDSWTETVDAADAATPGFALECWLAERGDPLRGAVQSITQLIEYRLRLRYRDRSAFRIQAALVRCHRLDDGIVYWTTREFHVPAGLWGIGIGDDFLRHLVQRFGRAGGGIWVRIPASASADPSALRTIANESQLYRSAGFREFEPDRSRLEQIAARTGADTTLELLHASTWLRL